MLQRRRRGVTSVKLRRRQKPGTRGTAQKSLQVAVDSSNYDRIEDSWQFRHCRTQSGQSLDPYSAGRGSLELRLSDQADPPLDKTPVMRLQECRQGSALLENS
jgi:hypothetical protein